MNEDDLALTWAYAQIAAARVPVPVGKAVVALLKLWGTLEFTDDSQQEKALDLFSKLAVSTAVEDPEDDTQWVSAVQVGRIINIGDTVRVKHDAFPGAAGQKHNGRIGRVIGKRSGDIIVRSTDNKSPRLEAHYPPSALELPL
ncbi:hypothetical protein SEA_CECE_93 [Microbacterium phage Cece]|nr:hypothetical protein SEA_CECE_93 [Microbacterium phage Cece]